MKKREQEFTTKFQRWLKYRWVGTNAYFEVKVAKSGSLPFSAVKDHQISNLQLPRVIHKFSDALQWGTLFDVILCDGKGFVVIYYHKPGNKEFFVIPVGDFITERDTSKRKSLTEFRARQISSPFFLA